MLKLVRFNVEVLMTIEADEDDNRMAVIKELEVMLTEDKVVEFFVEEVEEVSPDAI